MTITHHPALESLLSCSAGSMPEAFAAVMASHIAMCPECRKELALMHDIGTTLFAAIAPTPVSRGAPVLAMRGEESEPCGQRPPSVQCEVPEPLRAAIGPSLDTVPWTLVVSGIWQHRIALSPEAGSSLRLVKVAPGRTLPEHTHKGSELTLVLRGSFRDGDRRYCVGDVSDVGNGDEHAPVADLEQGCICVVAIDGKLRFQKPLARIVQPLTGF